MVTAPSGTGARSPVAAIVIGAGVTVVCTLPVFLTGAMAVQLTDDLLFGATALGIAIASFHGSAAVTSGYLGRLTDRIGATWSLRISLLLSATAAGGIAATARSWATLVAWLVVAGAGRAISQAASNRLLVDAVPSERRGMAFGFKQSAPPTATTLAGFSVPTLAVTFGWRSGFAVVLAMAVVVLVAIGRQPSRSTPAPARGSKQRPKLGNRAAILTLIVAFFLSTAASSSIPAFYVDAAVRTGATPETAGLLLSAAGIAAILARLGGGFASDRLRSGHIVLCAGMLVAGAFGLGLLAVGGPALMGVGAAVALAGTWGLNGVFWFAMTRAYPDQPGAITGAIMPGGLVGGVVGPILFGAAVDAGSYPAAWTIAAGFAVLAAGAMLLGARRLAAGS